MFHSNTVRVWLWNENTDIVSVDPGARKRQATGNNLPFFIWKAFWQCFFLLTTKLLTVNCLQKKSAKIELVELHSNFNLIPVVFQVHLMRIVSKNNINKWFCNERYSVPIHIFINIIETVTYYGTPVYMYVRLNGFFTMAFYLTWHVLNLLMQYADFGILCIFSLSCHNLVGHDKENFYMFTC